MLICVNAGVADSDKTAATSLLSRQHVNFAKVCN